MIKLILKDDMFRVENLAEMGAGWHSWGVHMGTDGKTPTGVHCDGKNLPVEIVDERTRGSAPETERETP